MLATNEYPTFSSLKFSMSGKFTFTFVGTPRLSYLLMLRTIVTGYRITLVLLFPPIARHCRVLEIGKILLGVLQAECVVPADFLRHDPVQQAGEERGDVGTDGRYGGRDSKR